VWSVVYVSGGKVYEQNLESDVQSMGLVAPFSLFGERACQFIVFNEKQA
jgi:hypothetical protein